MVPATFSAWRIRASPPLSRASLSAIDNLYLATDIPMPTPTPRTALISIKAAALNSRDMAVIAHDPIYPIETTDDLTPCADGAGVVVDVGEESIWKVGDRVIIHPTVWVEGDDPPTLEGSQGLGAGNVQGTLREYGIFVRPHLLFNVHLSESIRHY